MGNFWKIFFDRFFDDPDFPVLRTFLVVLTRSRLLDRQVRYRRNRLGLTGARRRDRPFQNTTLDSSTTPLDQESPVKDGIGPG